MLSAETTSVQAGLNEVPTFLFSFENKRCSVEMTRGYETVTENLVEEWKDKDGKSFDSVKEDFPQSRVEELEQLYRNKDDILPLEDREEIEQYSKLELKFLVGLLLEDIEFATSEISLKEQYVGIVQNLSEKVGCSVEK